MNKIIQTGNTLSAVAKIGVAVGVLYVGYEAYQLSQDASESIVEVQEKLDTVIDDTEYFVTETVNPGSYNNFINQSFIGDILGKPVDAIIDFFRD